MRTGLLVIHVTVISPESLVVVLKWVWLALMFPFLCPWHGMVLAVGKPAYLVIYTRTARKRSVSTHVRNPLCNAGLRAFQKGPSLACLVQIGRASCRERVY